MTDDERAGPVFGSTGLCNPLVKARYQEGTQWIHPQPQTTSRGGRPKGYHPWTGKTEAPRAGYYLSWFRYVEKILLRPMFQSGGLGDSLPCGEPFMLVGSVRVRSAGQLFSCFFLWRLSQDTASQQMRMLPRLPADR